MATDAWLTRRAEVVAEGNELLDHAEDIEMAGDLDPFYYSVRKLPEREAERLSVLQREYRELLPDVPVARCPDTGTVVRWSIDTGDLDGWFWDADHRVSRKPDLPASWLAMTGAVALGGPVAWAPFLCMPGPSVPYVVPRVLNEDGVRAVITQVPIGPHRGWAVTYFGPRLSTMDSIGQWGLGGWWPQLGGDGTDHNFHFDPADNDYDLDSYLVSGKLLWIAPGDGTALLREDARGCPYRGLEGSHEATYIDRCEIWDSTRELDYFGGALGLYVEFNGAGMPPAQLDRLRSALALEPVEDRPREENAVLGRRKTGTDLPPGSYLLLMRGTPWRLELMCEGAYPTQRVLGKVRTRLLATLAELGLERLEVTQWRANGTPREY